MTLIITSIAGGFFSLVGFFVVITILILLAKPILKLLLWILGFIFLFWQLFVGIAAIVLIIILLSIIL